MNQSGTEYRTQNWKPIYHGQLMWQWIQEYQWRRIVSSTDGVVKLDKHAEQWNWALVVHHSQKLTKIVYTNIGTDTLKLLEENVERKSLMTLVL